MSSIRRIQTERLLEDVLHALYSGGTKPTTSKIMKRVSRHFSEYPAGQPLPIPRNVGTISNADDFTMAIEHTQINIDVLYESMIRQLEQTMQLVDTMSGDIQRLSKRRRELDTLITDYLLATVNADGYFYTLSDVFATLTKVDLSLTSAQVNVEKGEVSLPSLPYTTTTVPPESYGLPSITAFVDGVDSLYEEKSSFQNATESSLQNTHWHVEVVTDSPASEVVLSVRIPITTQSEITKLTFDPYGIEPVQLAAFYATDDGGLTPFGSSATTSSDEMTLSNRAIMTSSITLTLRKTQPDYSQSRNGAASYRYIFGAKTFELMKTVYDYDATFVSSPLSIDPNLRNESAIDAVSLEVTEQTPDGTSIDYYVGASSGEDESLGDINWKSITPVNSDDRGGKVVSFEGSGSNLKIARSKPSGVNDIQLKPIIESGPVSERNPSLEIFPGTEVYRIAEIDENALRTSLSMVEGLNTTRIYYRPMDKSKSFDDIDVKHWAPLFQDSKTQIEYARIDSGNDFFYGGNIGASDQDVYIETFLNADNNYATFLSQFIKSDTRSRTWDVKVLLNGRVIGDLPSGTDKAQLPWNFNLGLNHVVLLIRIPSGQSSFLGTVRLLRNEKLYDYGTVSLKEWSYIDPFEMKYNERGTKNATFTIVDGEIVSRRPPTDNFQIKYNLDSGNAPEFIRFRADLSRVQNSATITPALKQYRVRFAYGDE